MHQNFKKYNLEYGQQPIHKLHEWSKAMQGKYTENPQNICKGVLKLQQGTFMQTYGSLKC